MIDIAIELLRERKEWKLRSPSFFIIFYDVKTVNGFSCLFFIFSFWREKKNPKRQKGFVFWGFFVKESRQLADSWR